MTSASSTTLRETSPSRPVRRSSRRLSATHILIAVVVILAFVLNLLVIQDRDATVLVAVADRQLTSGSTFTADAVRLVPVDAGFEGLPSLIAEDDLASFEGWVLERPIPAQGLIEVSALVEPGGPSGLRSMSIPVAVEHAAGGSVRSGDRVDVVSVVDGVAGFVATNLEVIGVSESTGAAIGSTTGYHVVVAVSAEDALRLAEAIDAGSLEIVKSTGAPVVAGDGGDS